MFGAPRVGGEAAKKKKRTKAEKLEVVEQAALVHGSSASSGTGSLSITSGSKALRDPVSEAVEGNELGDLPTIAENGERMNFAVLGDPGPPHPGRVDNCRLKGWGWVLAVA
jgi:hypothetical protein